MEYRYRDKAYLTNYMLDTKLFDEFNFVVEDATPIRTIYFLSTNEGMKILKKVDYSLEELMFIYNSLTVIRRKFPYVINFRKRQNGEPYIEYEGGIYVVLDVIEGRECSFELPVDLKNSSKALAAFHKAGENINMNCEKRNKVGKLIDDYNRKYQDLERYKDIAKMHYNKSSFDKIYLEYADYYMEDIKKAIKQAEDSSYKDLCQVKHSLCHHDLAYHNIIISNENDVYFIDFDYSIIDTPYHDLSNMITKAIKHIGWNSENADSIMEAYMEEGKMSKDEINVLYAYLMFPQDFYEISMSYYMRTRSWDEDDFADKLIRKAEYKDEREKFLKDFKSKWI